MERKGEEEDKKKERGRRWKEKEQKKMERNDKGGRSEKMFGGKVKNWSGFEGVGGPSNRPQGSH